MPLGQDHVRTMTGMIEIQCAVPTSNSSNGSSGSEADPAQRSYVSPTIQPMFVTCSLDGSIVLYEIKPLEGVMLEEGQRLEDINLDFNDRQRGIRSVNDPVENQED